jgi:hypothetical protein
VSGPRRIGLRRVGLRRVGLRRVGLRRVGLWRVGLALLSAAVMLVLPTSALADHDQISTFQDDTYLIFQPMTTAGDETVANTLKTLQSLGVEQVRVNVEWANIAPDPLSATNPSSPYLNLALPSSYPDANWAPYDRLVELAPEFGIDVEFNLTSPGPLWAMGSGAPNTKTAPHWEPNAADFTQFAYAIGDRYSGTYTPAGDTSPLPAVKYWSIWNEPNQPGWLAPQWSKVDGKEVAESPQLYRALVNDGYYGLVASGHTKDTILIGETAPEGSDTGSALTAMTPGPFVRDLYCVNSRYRRLTGATAKALGCPTSGSAAAFVKANPALFEATGYAHHPYDFVSRPTYSFKDANDMPLENIGRLERLLNGAFKTYGVHRTLPLYFTEYGYETKPPDPHRGVSLATQAAYLNESDYMSWRNPRVRSVAQFLLYDAAPNALFTPNQYDYWDTFQTGLLFQNGQPKPSFDAYRVPIWIPSTHFVKGSKTFIWGQVRPADQLLSQSVQIQWRSSKGSYQTLTTARTGSYTGFLTASVKLPGNGYVRLDYQGMYSRAVPVVAR